MTLLLYSPRVLQNISFYRLHRHQPATILIQPTFFFFLIYPQFALFFFLVHAFALGQAASKGLLFLIYKTRLFFLLLKYVFTIHLYYAFLVVAQTLDDAWK